jgi:hypothetical protein
MLAPKKQNIEIRFFFIKARIIDKIQKTRYTITEIIITVKDKEIADAPKKPLNNKVKTTQIIIPITSTGSVLYQKSFPKIRWLNYIIQLNFYFVENQYYELYVNFDI